LGGEGFGPVGLWSERYFALESPYKKGPIDENLIARIYHDAAGACAKRTLAMPKPK
jgi:hypothetical protein